MLPDGFEVNGHRDTYRLSLNGQVIALSTELDNGGCRVCLHPNFARHMRFVFRGSPGAGVDYMERWATKWELELRRMYGGDQP